MFSRTWSGLSVAKRMMCMSRTVTTLSARRRLPLRVKTALRRLQDSSCSRLQQADR